MRILIGALTLIGVFVVVSLYGLIRREIKRCNQLNG